MEKVTKKEINVEVDDRVANGVYANLVVVNHSDTEFVVDFISIMPGMPKAKVRSRVILSPPQAKHLMHLLSENIYQYEHDQQILTQEEILNKHPHFGNTGEA